MRTPPCFSTTRAAALLLVPLLSLSCTGAPEESVQETAASETTTPSMTAAAPTLATVLVAAGDTWRYLDTGADLGTGWTASGFADGTWAQGAAPLGYAEADLATTVSFGTSATNKHITTYLRKSFTVEEASRVSALFVRFQRDDGVAVYLNGAEVLRSNLPAGTVGYRTLASATVAEPAEETTWLAQSISTEALRTGTNVLAVELHQAAASSSDLRFDLELSATVEPAPSPISSCYPFDLPATSVLRASPKKVFGFYYPIFPISIENADPASDHWLSWLTPEARNGEYASIGGLMRDRPLPRAPWADSAWRQRDFEVEVRRAIAAGLDGFIYEHPYRVSSDTRNNQLPTMLAAAAAVDPDFRIVLSPDFPTEASGTTDGLVTTIAGVANHPSVYRLDGSIVLASFSPERKPLSFWATLRDRLAAQGISITYWPLLPYTGDTTKYADWNDLVAGYSTWGERTAASAENMRRWSVEAHRRGKYWMSPVAFEDVRHKLTDSVDSSRVYWEAQNSLAFRSQFEKAIEGDADWVTLLTLTDYTESWMTASRERGYVIMDWIAYYTTWFKLGRRPTILRDALYYTHREHRTDAPYDTSRQTARAMRLRGGTPASNQVELLAFLKEPGQLVITQGSDVRTLDVTSAGVTAFPVPMVPGTTPVFDLRRNGQSVQRIQSATPILGQVVYQDMMYHAGGGRSCTRP
ncbi:endo-1,3-alpha-glucanase family glycosylhydrolase [Pyxidicoccus caerfyrddinensis]|uniref:endo-1,3-alpha-glucanase family glycosylhydrolase n=1 Tax=Pyxidicoccus caerfyrddinensis TaxID=2709663 RepID=UPI0013DC6A76|nr:endo-1,3-alpha-glucanase family glycosylhydrolase [Pyxidicoccus caerfyrddinensis]